MFSSALRTVLPPGLRPSPLPSSRLRWGPILLRAAGLALLVAAASPPPLAARAQSAEELRLYQGRLQKLYRRLDRNGDGRLDRSEVEGHPYLERHFERLGGENRGYLDPGQLIPRSTEAMGERLREFFSRADRNGDGRIDRAEAEAFSWMRRRFAEVDANGDGGLSWEELGRQRRRWLSQPNDR
ncbi:EF-hand domain-containing protein [Vulcanococcus limneticus]|uniref:EF-hand domain-containing protein n=1 Tax=Vulcanococcus limneticus TaxID=2170428 RepID=UPI000B98ECB2|nr:EF-hand domain-containing protein [Vulcanococcus limneticus]MCP9791255.1 EF-hand domain-containing protein [Vulcanococcus limneticus MW73D5]MCP9893285.1 EF-hand domain-containing protein [Vulcanococcus limneticus Candia 3F8]MCP9896698.1 EF-hand domain-containing protein [Vulcanococcus limneticus Candia 3B3]